MILDEACRKTCFAGFIHIDLLQVSYEGEARQRCRATPDVVLWVPAHAQRDVGPGVDVLKGCRDRDGEDRRLARVGLAVAEVVHQADGRAVNRWTVLGGVLRGGGEDGRESADALEAEDAASLSGRLAGCGDLEAGIVAVGVGEETLR